MPEKPPLKNAKSPLLVAVRRTITPLLLCDVNSLQFGKRTMVPRRAHEGARGGEGEEKFRSINWLTLKRS